MKGVSVIICTYNGASRLPETLKHLARQVVSESILWEVILVNNASSDDTVGVANAEWTKYNLPHVKLNIFDQPIPGKTFAFEKGVKESLYDYILICDDDNWLYPNYIQKIYELFESGSCDIVGGWGIAECEIAPPLWFQQLKGFGYAIGKEGNKTGLVKTLYGAGMGIKKSNAINIILNPKCKFLVVGRNAKNLVGGEDIELCLILDNKNIYFDEQLIFEHYITKKRLSWKYYLQLRKSFGIGNSFLIAYQYAKTNCSASRAILNYVKRIFRALRSAWRVKYLFLPVKYQNSTCANYYENLGFLSGAISNLPSLLKNITTAKNNLEIVNSSNS